MYQVVELYGYFEPWWFLEDWKEDIVAVESFDSFEEALAVFKRQWAYLKISHPYYKSQANLLSAFWDNRNQSQCEDCAELVQEYRSLALLKDWQELPESYHQAAYQRRNDPPSPLTSCKLKKIG